MNEKSFDGLCWSMMTEDEEDEDENDEMLDSTLEADVQRCPTFGEDAAATEERQEVRNSKSKQRQTDLTLRW